jgi:hypothetical protein
MSDTPLSDQTTGRPEGEERMSALFAQLVMQQANMAMMFLGKGNQPQGGEPVKDIDAARLFIDELEMLEVKTKGNLTKEESTLLKQTLMSLRLAFVEAVESTDTAAKPAAQQKPQTESSTTPPSPNSAPASVPEEEHRKKFTKKY